MLDGTTVSILVQAPFPRGAVHVAPDCVQMVVEYPQ